MTTETTVPAYSETQPVSTMFTPVEQAIEDIRAGKFVVVADDEGRENEGDLICAAATMTAGMVNFATKEARGLVCVTLSAEQAERLNLPQMVDDNTDPNQTAFTVSVDAGPEFGVTTGISASDRAITIQRLAATNATPQDFRRPGHVFPLQAKNGGVLRRVGHSEAATDLTRLAGLNGVGVICEILNDDGSMARRDDLSAFAKKHGLSFITVAQLIQYRLQTERSVVRRVSREIDTKFGRFTAIGYRDTLDGAEHLALVKGSMEELASGTPYVRIQHENIITDVLAKEHDLVPHEMAQSLSIIEAQGKGAVVYLRNRDDSSHGLVGSLKAYTHGTPHDAYHAGKSDLRDYGVGAQILLDLGIKRFCMLGKSTRKVIALRGYGLEITSHLPLVSSENPDFAESLAMEENKKEKTILNGVTLPVASIPAFIPAAASEEVPPVTPSFMMAHVTSQPSIAAAAPMATVAPAALATTAATPVVTAPVQQQTPLNENKKAEPASAEEPKPVVAKQDIKVANGSVASMPQQAPAPVAAAEPNVVPVVSEMTPLAAVAGGTPMERPVMKMGGQIMSNQALFEG